MITGFNTDVEHRGAMFHVQTEERGPTNPVMVTLVYCGGQVVASLEFAYSSDLEAARSLEAGEIRERMRLQHQGLIDAIRRGTYDAPPRPFGERYVSNRSLDEVVLGYLEEEIADVERSTISDPAVAELGGGPQQPKVQRVLDRLGRFLDAAERAEQLPPDARAAPVAERAPRPKTDELAAESAAEPEAFVLPASFAEPRARDDRHRTPTWVWLTTAAILFAGGISLFFFGGRVPARELAAPRPSAVRIEPPENPPAPAVASPVPAQAETTELRHDPPLAARSPVEVVTPPAVAPQRTPKPVETGPEQGELKPATASRPAASAGDLLELSEVDVAPMPRRRDLPRYTRRARRLHQTGQVRLRVLIDHHGDVEQVELLKDVPESDLGMASVAAAGAWTFSPARKDGVPVRVWQEVALIFSQPDGDVFSVKIEE